MIAFICIVCCHFLQYFGNELSLWLNVGVQIFLFISGYLYGVKYTVKKVDICLFYCQRFIKIMVPYFTVIVPAIFLHIFLLEKSFSVMEIFSLFICNLTISGGEHLWFVSTILMCYLLTPIFHFCLQAETKWKYMISVIVFSSALFIYFCFFDTHCNAANIICYFLGFAFSRNQIKKIMNTSLCNIVFILLSLQNALEITDRYFYHFIHISDTLYQLWHSFNHVWLAISLFIIFRYVLSKVDFQKHNVLTKLLKISDTYSYEGYLVHQFVILGPLSLLNITAVSVCNIVITLFAIVLLTVILKNVNDILQRKIRCC